MTTKPSLSRQASAISILLAIVGGARAKPRNPSELAMLLEDGRAAEGNANFIAANAESYEAWKASVGRHAA